VKELEAGKTALLQQVAALEQKCDDTQQKLQRYREQLVTAKRKVEDAAAAHHTATATAEVSSIELNEQLQVQQQ